jgi:hypothetical protein
MDFEVIGRLRDVETIAVGAAIRDVARLRRAYGKGRWRKRKAMAPVQSGWRTDLCVRPNCTGTRPLASASAR